MVIKLEPLSSLKQSYQFPTGESWSLSSLILCAMNLSADKAEVKEWIQVHGKSSIYLISLHFHLSISPPVCFHSLKSGFSFFGLISQTSAFVFFVHSEGVCECNQAQMCQYYSEVCNVVSTLIHCCNLMLSFFRL